MVSEKVNAGAVGSSSVQPVAMSSVQRRLDEQLGRDSAAATHELEPNGNAHIMRPTLRASHGRHAGASTNNFSLQLFRRTPRCAPIWDPWADSTSGGIMGRFGQV